MPQTEPKTDGPLLELTLAPVRPHVTIDGKPYELRLLEHDFTLIEHHELQRDISEFDELWNKPKLTSKEAARLDMLLERVFVKVITLPATVASKLTALQKRHVITVFQLAPFAMTAPAPQKATKAGSGSRSES